MPAIFPFLPAHIGIARANLPSERGTISMTAHQETMNEILDLLDELNVDQLANLGHKIKGIAEKRGALLPWILWAKEDFNPDAYEITEQKAEMAMDYAWNAVLANKRFTDLAETDRERVNEAIAEGVEAVSASDFEPGLTRAEADAMERRALTQLEPWVVYEVPERRSEPEPHWHSNWGVSPDGEGMYWYESFAEMVDNHFGIGRLVPRVRMGSKRLEIIR
ncbi:hypothetical protein ACT3UA_11500 [Glutamicibacter sp. 363]|uniref:hypothetical protein n=1 Tax=Glutamicibacter sp. 363 TaxID=3457731 RepID=UPI00403424B7